jgi:serine protease AprX
MLLQQPDGQKRLGNEDVPQGLKIPDPTNNVEVIRIDDAPPGTYTVQVFARNLLRGPQDFALVVTGALGGTLRRVPG